LLSSFLPSPHASQAARQVGFANAPIASLRRTHLSLTGAKQDAHPILPGRGARSWCHLDLLRRHAASAHQLPDAGPLTWAIPLMRTLPPRAAGHF